MTPPPPILETDRCPCGSGRAFEDCCLEAGPGQHHLTAERLEAWGSGRGLGEALRTVVHALPGGADRVVAALPRWMRSGLAVSQVLQGDFPTVPGLERAVRALRRAAWAFLQEEAVQVRQGLLEEAEPLAWPRDPTLHRVAERLRTLRVQVRRTSWPRSLAQLGRCHLRVLPEPRRVKVVDLRRVRRHQTGGLVEPEVELSLARALDEPLTPPRCSCEARLPCDHLLAAIDLTLVHLTDPYPSAEWSALARALETPDWSRALQAIDGLQAARLRDAAAGQHLRVAFRLSSTYGGRVEAVPFLQRRKKDGTFGPGRKANRRDLAEGLAWFGAEDRTALDRLGYLEPLGSPYGMSYGAEGRRAHDLEALVGYPRVSLDGSEATRVEVRVARLGLTVRAHPEGGLEVAAVVDGEAVDPEEVRRHLPGGSGAGSYVHLQPERSRCLVVKVDDLEGTRVVLTALASFGQRFPAEAEGALLDRLGPLQALLPVEVPEGIEGREVPPAAQQVLRLELLEVGLSLKLLARPLDGAPAQPPGAGPARLLAIRPGGRTFTRRELGEERARARALLRSLGLEVAEAGPFAGSVDDDGQALLILEKLRALDRPDLTLEWVGPKARLVRASAAAELRVAVRDRGDWFGLQGTVEVDGEQVQLALLLEALRERRPVVRLAGGVWLTITAELAARLAPLAQLSSQAAGGKAPAGEVEIGPSALGLLDDLAGDGARLDARGAFAGLRARMRAAGQRSPRVPQSFKGKLRDYQVEGFRWLARLASWGAGAVLADDMGLGKTLQALALLCHRAKEGPALVVAPTSVCSNWVAEAGRFAPGLKVTLFREADRAGAVEALGPGDVLVVSYGLLTLDLERFRRKRFATLVLDEAQAIKNAATRRARAVREVEADFRVGLSGTPVENHLGELWSLYRVIFPGLLGSWEVFKRRFAQPIERDGDVERRRALSATIRPFLLRRAKAEVARELPTRTEIALPVALSKGERRLYEQARLAIVAKLAGLDEQAPPERRRFQVLAAITQLRLLACHPRLHEAESLLPSSKLARFLELAAELREGGHRTLVFSQFTSHLALVREALDAAGVAYLYLDGQTPPKQRDRLVARFQAGEGELFLISLKAGGTGLNLTAADYVVHLDPWWNPAVEDQATDRAHRIGQRRPVTVYRLLSTGTIEETIVTLHARKRDLVAGVLGGMDAAARLSPTALLALIREGAGGPAGSEAESVRADVVAEEVGDWAEGAEA